MPRAKIQIDAARVEQLVAISQPPGLASVACALSSASPLPLYRCTLLAQPGARWVAVRYGNGAVKVVAGDAARLPVVQR